jgi:uncharacterized protein involved in outer membrane biogenesis
MRRLIILLSLVAVLVAIGAGVWLSFSLEGLVRRAIVSQVAAATGVDVQLAAVRLRAKEQSGELQKFRLGNPSGYSSREPLFAFERAHVALDVATLREPVVRLRQVELEQVTFFYSGGASGNNLETLAAQIAMRGKQSKSAPDETPRRLVIDSLVIDDARVRLDLPGVGHTPELRLGTLRFSNLGGKDGDTIGQIIQRISPAISDRATAAVAKALPGLAVELGLSPEKLAEMLGLPVPGPLREAADFLRGIFSG